VFFGGTVQNSMSVDHQTPGTTQNKISRPISRWP